MGKSPIDWIAAILVIIGGLNWGLVGAFNFDLVAAIFGSIPILQQAIYIIVGLAAIWMIVVIAKKKGK